MTPSMDTARAAGTPSPARRLPLLCAGRAGTCMGMMTFAGALPVLQQAWHMDAATAGTIQTAFNLANAIALLAAAWLADTFGARRVYLCCTWAGALALACFAAFARSPQSALVLIVLVGLTQGGAYAPALLLAAELSPASRRGRAMGQMLAAGSFGYLLSVSLSLWAAQTWGPTAAFTACAAGVLAGAILGHVSLAGMPVPARRGNGATSSTSPLQWKTVFSPAALCLLVAYVAHCWELLGSYAWTPSLLATALRPLHLDPLAQALLVGAVAHLSGMLATPAIGILSDRWNRSNVLVAVAATGAACSLLMGWSTHWAPAWTVVLAAIGSFFILGDSSALSAAMTEAVPADSLGRVMGVRSVLGFGAGALAPAAFGVTLDGTGSWAASYAILAAGGAIACGAALCLRRLESRSTKSKGEAVT
ncbi:MFS transporter [Massilia sp. METH4]|uniref:MFS transporter n=1 Tax=Massilia sp. METH4 TaxID=3123041 RepID=UPI0030D6194E